jgi:hypothetical protein
MGKETKKKFLEFFSKPDKEIYRTDTPMDSPEVEEAREILDEGKIYSNVPIDHPDVQR